MNYYDGKITLVAEQLLELRTNKFRDSVILHEIAHSKFHSTRAGLDLTINNDWVLRNIICDLIEITGLAPDPNKYKSKDEYENECWNLMADTYKDYLAKLEMSSLHDRSTILSAYREKCIDIFRKYDKGGHTNVSEFEADKFAAGITGSDVMIKTLKRLLQTQRQYEKSRYTSAIQQFKSRYNASNKTDFDTLRYRDSTRQAHAEYITRIKTLEIDVAQRIKVLSNPDILGNPDFKEVYK